MGEFDGRNCVLSTRLYIYICRYVLSFSLFPTYFCSFCFFFLELNKAKFAMFNNLHEEYGKAKKKKPLRKNEKKTRIKKGKIYQWNENLWKCKEQSKEEYFSIVDWWPMKQTKAKTKKKKVFFFKTSKKGTKKKKVLEVNCCRCCCFFTVLSIFFFLNFFSFLSYPNPRAKKKNPRK